MWFLAISRAAFDVLEFDSGLTNDDSPELLKMPLLISLNPIIV